MFLTVQHNGIKKTDRRMDPLKFMLWIAIGGIIMMFAGFTSAYIVRQAEGNWLKFELPKMFWITTFVILISSITIQWAVKSVQKNDFYKLITALIATTLLGLIFLLGQITAWQELHNTGIFLNGNPSGSFLYILTGLHALHLLGGVFLLLIVLVGSLQKKYNSDNTLHVELCATYWHFLDGLWIYLFLFLLYSNFN